MRPLSLILCWCIIILAGCSTSVRLRVERAPELSLTGIEKLKIDRFGVTGKLDLELIKKEGDVLGTIAKIAIDAGTNKMAKRQHPSISASHRQGLKSVISSHGYYKVTEGADFDAKIGGDIYYNVKDAGQEKVETDKKGNSRKYYELTRNANVSLQITVTDKKGEVIGTSSAHARAWNRTRKDNHTAAIIGAEIWHKVVKNALAASHSVVLQRIAPYSVWQSRKLVKGKSKSVKKGIKAARKGNWPEAVFLWKSAQNTGNHKDKAAALYNLGVYDEKEGRLEDALSKYEQVLQLSGDAKFANDVERKKARIEEEERIKSSREGVKED